MDPCQLAAQGRGPALSYAAFRVPEQQGATSLQGPCQATWPLFTLSGHLHRNMGMERPRAPYRTANGLQGRERGCVAGTSSLPSPGPPLFAELAGLPLPPARPQDSTQPCPAPTGWAYPPHSSEEQHEARVTDQDTCVLPKPSGHLFSTASSLTGHLFFRHFSFLSHSHDTHLLSTYYMKNSILGTENVVPTRQARVFSPAYLQRRVG